MATRKDILIGLSTLDSSSVPVQYNEGHFVISSCSWLWSSMICAWNQIQASHSLTQHTITMCIMPSVEIREIIPATSYRQDIHNSIIYKRICKWLNYGILRLGYGSHANCDKLHLMWNPLNYVTASLFTTHMINWKSSVDDDTSCMFRIYFIHITYIHIFMFMLV